MDGPRHAHVTDPVSPKVGFLGTGSIAAAMVTGLCTGPDRSADIAVSPRGAPTAAELADRFGVRIMAGNQDVVDRSDLVVVCLRQGDVGLLDDLRWRSDQVVVSVVAGVSLDALAALVSPATSLARAVPMPEVATRRSATPVHPALPAVRALFDALGGCVALESSEQFDAVFTALGSVAPFFDYLHVLAEFIVDRGVDAVTARGIVADAFAGVGTTLADAEPPDFAALLREYAPPGGGNALFAEACRAAGVPESTRAALEATHRRLTG